MNTHLITKQLDITGSVQGVGFRPFIVRLAFQHKLNGFVQNRGNYVKIVIQGSPEQLKVFSSDILSKKPPLAVIQKLEESELPSNGLYKEFSIIHSETDRNKKTTGYIPPDITICDQCIDDMTKGDRVDRKNYPFTSCVDCGPRYSVIKGIPYDRPLTTMDAFPFCPKCEKEYKDSLNRRFHAQTTCCRKCGPAYSLYDSSGSKIELNEAKLVQEVKKLLLENQIVAIKGIGGTHLATNVFDEQVITKLRKRKGDRKRKPFALMSYSLDTIQSFATIPSPEYRNMLLSPRRPIVLLLKKANFPLPDIIAPHLHTIGVMLPYTGLHYLLLQEQDLQTMVLTSANLSHLPIQKDNEEILSSLKGVADYFLLHNREIYQRNDDSVIKILPLSSQTNSLFIRRSRGYTPEPVHCPIYNRTTSLIGLGSELHTAPAIVTQNKLFMTQYIGNLRYEETFAYYKDAIRHVTSLLQGPEMEAVAHDLHPQLLSTEYARELAREKDIPIYPFQHHTAHAASLLLDTNTLEDEAIIVTADGLGYGEDGNIWGGEVLYTNLEEYKRLDHIRYVQQPGGDVATKYPLRMVLSNLKQAGLQNDEITTIVMNKSQMVDQTKKQEVNLILNQLDKRINTPLTSSTGRFLDACSTALGFCSEASYEGEPAIILEGMALQHTKPLEKNPFTTNPELSNKNMDFHFALEKLVEEVSKGANRQKLAYWIQEYVGQSYASNVLEHADTLRVKNVGFTGGVAYNQIIIDSFAQKIRHSNNNLKILLHKTIPPGDGGIGAGQAVLLAKKLIR